MEFSFLFGLLVNISMSIGAWLFAIVAYLGALFAMTWYGQFVAKQGFLTVLGIFVGSLIGTGILGCIASMLTYFIAYSLLSDFKNDYR
jgi:hypothetical protein